MPAVAFQTTRRLIGIEALAKEFDVSRSHLWRVVNGKRSSASLQAKLAERGIQCKKAPARSR